MYVVKRDGRQEPVLFDKITSRISCLCYGLRYVDPLLVAQRVIQGVYPGVTTSKLDDLAAEVAAYMSSQNYEYSKLAARIAVSNLHKNTEKSFSKVAEALYSYIDPKTNLVAPLLADDTYKVIQTHRDRLDAAIVHSRDFEYQYFGFKTLEQSYLLKLNGKVAERPQHMLMRVSVGIHGDDIDAVLETYNLLSEGWFTHATPTLFNAGTPRGAYSSCYLLTMKSDSIEGIYDTLKQTALISKASGGIGLSISDIRSTGSYIRGTNGVSNGLIPMIRVFNNTARYVDQCFTADTLVYSAQGLVPIGSLVAQDRVLDRHGRYSTIASVQHAPYRGPLIRIRTEHDQEIRTTPHHPFLVVGPDETRPPEYVEAQDLRSGEHSVLYPTVAEIRDMPTLSVDDCRFLGLMLGAGWMEANMMGISTSEMTDETLRFLQSYLTSRLVPDRPEIGDLIWMWSTPAGFPVTYGLLYDHGTHLRHIHPSLLVLPEDKMLALLQGLADTREAPLEITRELALRLPPAAGRVSPGPEGLTKVQIVHVSTLDPSTHDIMVVDLKMEHPIDNYVTVGGIVHNGGGKRKGAFALYLEPWHADVLEFLTLKMPTGAEELRARDLFFGLWVPDLFMQRVAADGVWSLMCPHECPGLTTCFGDAFEQLYTEYERQGKFRRQLRAREVWDAVLTAQIESGTPYMLYKDHINRKNQQANLGTIKSSNLCVHPDTPLLTRKGYFPIGPLKDQEVEVWNGHEWSRTTVRQTSEDSPMLQITFSDGSELVTTKYHKFYTQNHYQKPHVETEAQKLQVGDKLIKFDLPAADTFMMDAGNDVPYAYTHGLLCSTSGKIPAQGTLNDQIAPKYHVPIMGTVRNKLEWFAGYCDGDGCIATNPQGSQTLQICSINLKFLQDVRLMSHTLGLQPKIRHQEHRDSILPDGKGVKRRFICKDQWRILYTSEDLQKLLQLGWNPKRLKVNLHAGQSSRRHVTVERIEPACNSPTYCFNEPLRHMGVFNGILTSQCVEVCEFTSPDEVAVCNLASIALPKFVQGSRFRLPYRPPPVTGAAPAEVLETFGTQGSFDHGALARVVKVLVRNLNRVIDGTHYPVPEARYSNLKHRPIGIGVQGLADVFQLLHLPYESQEAQQLNRNIFETMYYAALEASWELAVTHGPYESFPGSPASQGQLQYDLWHTTPSNRWDFAALKARIMRDGLRNSLLIAPMPTASTSQILGNTESFEPLTSNLFVRRTLAGEFTVVNWRLVHDLNTLGLWPALRDRVLTAGGSIQELDEIPETIRAVYKTVWEMSGRTLVDMAAARGAFIDQSQSFNLYMTNHTPQKLTSFHFAGWERGLKTGMYYMRTQETQQAKKATCSLQNREGCTACSS